METQMETLPGLETATPLPPPSPERNGLTRGTGNTGVAACINSTEGNMTKTFLTPKEVATQLEVSAATVVRWVRDGIIPAKRFGKRIIKIPVVEVEKLLNQN